MDDDAIHISWHGLDRSEALERRIRAEVDKLRTTYPRAVACRVVIAQPHRHHRHGSHFVVKIELAVPGRVLVVGRDPSEHDAFDDPVAACTEAFARISRQLDEFIRLRHESEPRQGRYAKRLAT